MKRLFLLLVCALMLLPLGGCGEAAESAATAYPTLAEGSHEGQTPYINTGSGRNAAAETSPAPTQEVYESWEEMYDSFYDRLGNFYFYVSGASGPDGSALEAYRAMPQDEEASFVVKETPGADADKRLAGYSERNTLAAECEEIYLAVYGGDPPEGDYDVDKDKYPLTMADCAEDELIDKLPEEWFEKMEKLLSYDAAALDKLQTEISNEYALKTAEYFASLGCEAEVRSTTSSSDGVETEYYTCIVTVTPAKLFELAESTENMYFIEPLYDTVKARFDKLVWPEEGT